MTTPSEAAPTLRCVVYLRVSTDEQAQRDYTEEGFSLPAQRDGCLQHIRDQGWTVVDEYVDRDSASKRSEERPQFKAMLARIFEQGDVDAVVVHKLDRFARDAAHHLAVRAALRQKGVRLVSVQEQLEETASGRLVEGIHALMAEFYSANLASEVKKGMKQKAEIGGWCHRAPLGYINVNESAVGRRVSYVAPDLDRADLIGLAFQLYATGEYTLERLLDELRHRGLTNRGRKDYAPMPITMHGLTWMLTNKFYVGTIEWQGVEHKGLHEPLVDSKTFLKVQDMFVARSSRGVREVRHRHYLKGTLVCAVCGRGLSIQRSKGQYVYFYCLGQKDRRRPTGCKEAYIPAEKLERQVEELYQRVQLPKKWAARLRGSIEEEIIARQDRNSAERDFLTRTLAKLETERRKLLSAYYAGAIDVTLLRAEQERITREVHDIEQRMAGVEATLAEWQEILAIALKFAINCARAYRSANERTRKLYNAAVFDKLLVRDGAIAEVKYREPFELIFNMTEFEQRRVERETGIEPASGTDGSGYRVAYRLARTS
jgi:DNA invertase Pin-like site-specific DNA recombinase